MVSQYSVVKVKSPVNCQHPEGHPSADGKHKILDWPTHFVESGSHTRTVAEQRTCLSGKIDRARVRTMGVGKAQCQIGTKAPRVRRQAMMGRRAASLVEWRCHPLQKWIREIGEIGPT